MLSAISQRLLSEAAAEGDTGTTPPAFRNCGVLETTHLIEWSEGVSSGVVEIETAASEDYAGTWAPVSTVTFDGSETPAPKTEYVRVQGSYGAMRHRISTIVTDGTVTSKIQGSL